MAMDSAAHSVRLAQRREMTADERRQQIIDQAAALFDSGPYNSTSMDDIAAAVGIAKPTLYHYFKSKGEILFEIHEALIGRLLSRHSSPREGTPREQLLRIMEDILAFMQTRPGHMRVFFEHYRELPDEQRETIRLKREQFQSILERVLSDGVHSGEFRNIDIRLTSFQIFGACIWAYQWYVPGGRLQTEEIARQFWQQIIDGIGADNRAEPVPGGSGRNVTEAASPSKVRKPAAGRLSAAKTAEPRSTDTTRRTPSTR